MGTSICF